MGRKFARFLIVLVGITLSVICMIVSLTLITNGIRSLLDGGYLRRRSSILSGGSGM
jgi:peptide/nickel transport system permease protein